MTILIATHNPSKFARYQRMLSAFDDIDLVSLSDVDIHEKADEPFETARENAIHKARFYAGLSKLPTLSIDESVLTNFLPENEQPGVYVRRFADKKTELTDEEVLVIWKKIIDESPVKDKQFIWDYSIVFFNAETGKEEYVKAVNVTRVAKTFSPIILPGYPMSSFMIYQGADKPNSESTPEEKLQVDKGIFREFLEAFPGWISQEHHRIE